MSEVDESVTVEYRYTDDDETDLYAVRLKVDNQEFALAAHLDDKEMADFLASQARVAIHKLVATATASAAARITHLDQVVAAWRDKEICGHYSKALARLAELNEIEPQVEGQCLKLKEPTP